MGNLPLSSGPSSQGGGGGSSFATRRISSGITYYYTPVSDVAPAEESPASGSLPSADPSCTPMLPDSAGQPTSRPLLLFFSWLGAQPGPVAKYRDLYLDRMDVLVVRSGVMHFLWPRWGRDYGLEVLGVLEEPEFSRRPLLVHASSIGGYTFTQILTHIARGGREHTALAQRVVGHVYDSLVVGTLEHMAIGLGKTLVPRFEGLIKNAAMLYFWLFRSHTADFYNDSILVFHNCPITSPALFFSSEDDALCDQAVMQRCIDNWRTRGVSVESRKWKESVHAAHMRCHPEDYRSTLESFLNSLPISL
ncbi:uncharacterized protein LOC142890838 isoform X2 [Nelusetta ayraudi]|uniref:uncharacterized protein LOC142890838 isoform X2 n=1 Tax=Nelusetta ayraudi TaxID=303726 RepID=UPI003F6F411F